jgi:hypothetical protein
VMVVRETNGNRCHRQEQRRSSTGHSWLPPITAMAGSQR